MRIEAKISAGFAVAVLTLLGVGAASYRSINSLLDAAEWRRHTQVVLQRLDSLALNMARAESSRRGYVITGQAEFRQQGAAYIASVPPDLQDLRRLTADNPAQQRRLDAIEPLLQERLALLAESLPLPPRPDATSARQAELTARAAPLAERIKAILAEMQGEENRLLGVRDAAVQQRTLLTMVSIAAGSALAVLIALLAAFAIRRDLAARRQAEEELRQAKSELERRVAERTAELARSVEAQRTRARQQAVVSSLGQSALGESELQPLLRSTVVAVAEVLGVELCKVMELLPGGGEFLLRAGVGWKPGLVGAATVGADLASQAGFTLRSHEPVIVEDLREEARFSGPALLRDHGVVSGASVLIGPPESPWGVLGVHSTARRRFTSEDVNFLRAIANLLGTFIDRRRAEEALRRLNEELEQRVAERTAELRRVNDEMEAFTYSASHDLRAPLRHVDGFSKILLEDFSAALPAPARHFLERIREGSRHMAALIDDLLMLSRLGRAEVHRQPTALRALVESVRSGLQAELDGRAVEWRIGELPEAECDPALVKIALVNMLSNAVKFTGARTPAVIEVGCQEREGQPVYFVRDNGAGFDMRHAQKLFGVFQRLHHQDEFTGTGIGLATVQRVIHKHHGRIWAEATPGAGATFYFTLGGALRDAGANEITAGGGVR